jgi:hypothetical protein
MFRHHRLMRITPKDPFASTNPFFCGPCLLLHLAELRRMDWTAKVQCPNTSAPSFQALRYCQYRDAGEDIFYPPFQTLAVFCVESSPGLHQHSLSLLQALSKTIRNDIRANAATLKTLRALRYLVERSQWRAGVIQATRPHSIEAHLASSRAHQKSLRQKHMQGIDWFDWPSCGLALCNGLRIRS